MHLKGHEDMPQVSFTDIGAIVEKSIQAAAPIFGEGFRAIAEPGRYFASDCVSLVTRVYGRRVIFENELDEAETEYEELKDEEKKKDDSEESLTESDLMQHNSKIQ